MSESRSIDGMTLTWNSSAWFIEHDDDTTDGWAFESADDAAFAVSAAMTDAQSVTDYEVCMNVARLFGFDAHMADDAMEAGFKGALAARMDESFPHDGTLADIGHWTEQRAH